MESHICCIVNYNNDVDIGMDKKCSAKIIPWANKKHRTVKELPDDGSPRKRMSLCH